MNILAILSIISTLSLVGYSQSSCNYINWTINDWPNATTQDFEALIVKQTGSNYTYLDASDFETGGRFAGQSWTTIFWTNPTSFRPLGFKYAKIGAFNDPTVCITAYDTAGYKVEVMVYSLTSGAGLCVVDMGQDAYDTQDPGKVTVCDTSKIYACFTADTTTTTLSIAIYCTTHCVDGSDVYILYRFRRSGVTWTTEGKFVSDTTEMWCNMIANSISWPDSLSSSVPSSYSGADNYSSGNMASALIAFSLTLFMALLF